MNIMNMLNGADNNGMVEQLAQRFGINGNQVQSVIGQLLPALTGGFSHNAQQSGGLGNLLGMLQGQPQLQDTLPQQPQAVDTGNGILGQIFGSKDVSRQVADHTSQQTGVEPGIIKKMLPVLAVMAASALSKKLMNQPQQAHAGLLDQFLGGGQSHSMADTVMGLLSQPGNKRLNYN